ncbi:MAG: cytochrome [Pseudonocardiales bacterium]|nr:cytochrome [Pseudonocardiales bacterium]
MTTSDRCPVVGFDHHSQQHADDPTGAYRELRHNAPVAYTEAHGGYWVLSDYSSVFDAARNDDLFSSARRSDAGLAIVIPETPMHFHIPIELDPPEFRKFRKIVNLITAPAAVARLEGLVEHYTTWFIDDIIESGQADFADVIGVPAALTIDWLGLPTDEWKRYATAYHAVIADKPGSPKYLQAVQVDLPYLANQMNDVIAARRAEPQDDIISLLLEQEVDERPLTDDEVFGITDLLISGGTGTTASLVSQVLVWLHEHQDVRTRLIEDPSLLDRAIEEFLRYFSPTQALARTVTTDTEFHGCPMSAGDRVLVSWSSANRDENNFENPDEINIERWPNRHLAFGIGVHRCAGSHLARKMAHSVLSQMLERMPNYVIDTSRLERYPDQGANVGFRSIPASFTPGSRRLVDAQ